MKPLSDENDDLWKDGCWNCNLGTNCKDDLSFGDVADTKENTIATEIICQKDQQRHDTNDKCDSWEPRPEETNT